jgi:hypothetical protein
LFDTKIFFSRSIFDFRTLFSLSISIMVLDRQSASADSSALATTNPQPIVVADADRFGLASAINQSEIADWSNSATELIDTTPLP